MKRLRLGALFVLCLGVVLVVRIGLWLTRYQRVRAVLVRPCPEAPQPRRAPTVRRITAMIARAARFVPDASCLSQSIACQAVLSWRRIPSTIVMGVKRQADETLNWHAWVVWNDTIVLQGDDDGLAGFQRLHDLPTPSLHRPAVSS